MLRSGGLNKAAQNDYEYRLPVPGSVQVPEIGGCIRARLLTVQATAQVTGQVTAQVTAQEGGKTAFQGYNQPQLLNPRRLGAELTVRNWRPEDRFSPTHTKAPKKVKQLLQKMTEAERVSSSHQLQFRASVLVTLLLAQIIPLRLVVMVGHGPGAFQPNTRLDRGSTMTSRLLLLWKTPQFVVKC